MPNKFYYTNEYNTRGAVTELELEQQRFYCTCEEEDVIPYVIVRRMMGELQYLREQVGKPSIIDGVESRQ